MATVDGSSFESASSIYGLPPTANLDAVLAAKAAAMVGTSSSVDEGGEVCDNNIGGGTNKTKRIPAKPQSPSSTRSSSASSSSSSSDTYNQSGNVNTATTIVTATGAATSSSGAVAAVAMNTVGGILVKELPSRMKGSPSRTNVVTPIMVKHVAKFESVSDDEDKAEIG